jgi:hypothetical protein
MPRRRVAHRRRPQSRRRPHHRRRSTRGQSRRASANARTGESETAASRDPSAAPIGRGSYAAPPYSTPRRRSRRCSTAKDMGAEPWKVVADVPPVRLARQRGFQRIHPERFGLVRPRMPDVVRASGTRPPAFTSSSLGRVGSVVAHEECGYVPSTRSRGLSTSQIAGRSSSPGRLEVFSASPTGFGTCYSSHFAWL